MNRGNVVDHFAGYAVKRALHGDPASQLTCAAAQRVGIHQKEVLELIAFAALSQARTTRQGRGIALLGALLAMICIRGLGFGVAALVARHSWAVVALYACPIAAMGASVGYAFGGLSIFTRPKNTAAQGGFRMAE